MYNSRSYYPSQYSTHQYYSSGHSNYYPPPHGSRHSFAYQNYRNYSLAPSQVSKASHSSAHRSLSNGQNKADDDTDVKPLVKWWKRKEADDDCGLSWRIMETSRLESADMNGNNELWSLDKADESANELDESDPMAIDDDMAQDVSLVTVK